MVSSRRVHSFRPGQLHSGHPLAPRTVKSKNVPHKRLQSPDSARAFPRRPSGAYTEAKIRRRRSVAEKPPNVPESQRPRMKGAGNLRSMGPAETTRPIRKIIQTMGGIDGDLGRRPSDASIQMILISNRVIYSSKRSKCSRVPNGCGEVVDPRRAPYFCLNRKGKLRQRRPCRQLFATVFAFVGFITEIEQRKDDNGCSSQKIEEYREKNL